MVRKGACPSISCTFRDLVGVIPFSPLHVRYKRQRLLGSSGQRQPPWAQQCQACSGGARTPGWSGVRRALTWRRRAHVLSLRREANGQLSPAGLRPWNVGKLNRAPTAPSPWDTTWAEPGSDHRPPPSPAAALRPLATAPRRPARLDPHKSPVG